MQMRVASSSMVYRKVLKLTKNALERSSIGQVVNLLSNDVSRFEFAVTYIHYLWIGPLMVIAISVILYYEIGISVFFGVSFMVLFVPLQSKYLTSQLKFDKKFIFTYSVLGKAEF